MNETPQKDGISLIAAERQRQLSVKGWTPEHDGKHSGAQLLSAAMSYAEAASHQIRRNVEPGIRPFNWPWHSDWWKPSKDPIRNLEKAGALIAAEIDRLQRRKGIPSATTNEFAPFFKHCDGKSSEELMQIIEGPRTASDPAFGARALLNALKESPWPVDVWPRTTDDAGKFLRERLDDRDVTAVSGTLMRHGWQCAEKAVQEILSEQPNAAGALPLNPTNLSRGVESKDLAPVASKAGDARIQNALHPNVLEALEVIRVVRETVAETGMWFCARQLMRARMTLLDHLQRTPPERPSVAHLNAVLSPPVPETSSPASPAPAVQVEQRETLD